MKTQVVAELQLSSRLHECAVTEEVALGSNERDVTSQLSNLPSASLSEPRALDAPQETCASPTLPVLAVVRSTPAGLLRSACAPSVATALSSAACVAAFASGAAREQTRTGQVEVSARVAEVAVIAVCPQSSVSRAEQFLPLSEVWVASRMADGSV